ncbi:MAG TPA: hypothetical protein VD971_09580 [Phycisphaerales bacterium]|nr:hypothetical protein [Phycisphaerales bacterium]
MDGGHQPGTTRYPKVEVRAEHEEEHGWRYEIAVDGGRTGVAVVTMTLGWRDHDYWSGGSTPPSRVAQALVEYVLMHRAVGLIPSVFDAGRVRRWYPRVDADLRSTL